MAKDPEKVFPEQAATSAPEPLAQPEPPAAVAFNGPAHPVDAEQALMNAKRWALLEDDIIGVRGITRVDPPLAEDWVVVTFAVRNRWGDTPGQINAVAINGRRWDLEAPDESSIAAAEMVAEKLEPPTEDK